MSKVKALVASYAIPVLVIVVMFILAFILYSIVLYTFVNFGVIGGGVALLVIAWFAFIFHKK